MTAKTQTLLSVFISFIFYFSWTWFANSLVTDETFILVKCALVQGTYSAFMTLTLSTLITWAINKTKCYKFPFIGLIPPLLIQSSMVYLINDVIQTPNILLTIAPSIFFTAIYGIVFTFALLKKPEFQCNSH